MIDELARTITRRSTPLIDPTHDPAFEQVSARIRSSRLLVIGGAGSIGKAVVEAVCDLGAQSLHIVDVDENGLADLVRELRSSGRPLPARLRTSVVDFGGPGFARLLRQSGPFDVALNLAALKHVRSDRDAFSLHRMIDTNVRAVADLCRLAGEGAIQRVFSVSSDKAVMPESAMGATKRWMEKVVLAAGGTSARFANVAFSKGSLPNAILQRLERGEPISAPTGISRYFITHREAALMCVLSAFDAADGEILVPSLDASVHAISMVEVAGVILKARGLEPRIAATEEEARALAATRPREAAWWPCLFLPADTGGEKDLEELFYDAETVAPSRHEALAVVRARDQAPASLEAAMRLFESASSADRWERDAFIAAIRAAVPEFATPGAGSSLDERM